MLWGLGILFGVQFGHALEVGASFWAMRYPGGGAGSGVLGNPLCDEVSIIWVVRALSEVRHPPEFM